MSDQVGDIIPATVDEARRKAEAAMRLLDSETADTIIGEQTEEWKTLQDGAKGVMAMLWSMMQVYGVKQTPGSRKAMAQAILMVLTLVHTAYALGMRRERG